MTIAGVARQVETLCASGQLGPAHGLLLQAAEAGDAEGLFTLALWRVNGSLIQRDLPMARQLLGRATDAGHPDAALFHAYFLANGTGGTPDWAGALDKLRKLAEMLSTASRQIALLDRMELTGDGSPTHIAEARVISAAPHVSLASNFLSADEAVYVSEAATQNLQPSMVVDPSTGKLVRNPIRRSDDATFGVFGEDLVINAINRRIAKLSGTDVDQGEPLIVLRYQPGGEYRAHSDALAGADNQRIATVILYLNADYSGGETRFVETGLTIRGRIGDALLFRNVTQEGRADPMSRHAGLPVEAGAKWIATRWIRAQTYTYPAPRPALG